MVDVIAGLRPENPLNRRALDYYVATTIGKNGF